MTLREAAQALLEEMEMMMSTEHAIWCPRCGLDYRHAPRPSSGDGAKEDERG